MPQRATKIVNLSEDEFLEMSISEHIKNLKHMGFDVSDFSSHNTSLSEIRDYAIDLVYSDFMHYHTECQGGDYDPMHPNETVEEFLEHEDY
ncbi:MAG: hypothetical protein WCG01_04440 [bacterium]